MISAVFILFFLSSGLYAAPLARKMVDMTYGFDEMAQKYPPFRKFEMTVTMNGTLESINQWVQSEEYSSTTHAGTHMDSPSHIIMGGRNIHEISIEDFIAPAAVIDITEKATLDPDAGITVDDLLHWEFLTGQSLNGTVVLLNSGWGNKYRNRAAYIGTSGNDVTQMHFPGFEADAAQWLVDNRKIVGIGTDTLSFDKGNVPGLTSHRILLGSGIFGLENVANVGKIPIYGATLYIMPMKIVNASGAPTRIIATYPEIFPSRSQTLARSNSLEVAFN